MGIINEIFRTHGPAYLQRYGESMPDVHKKVLDAILQCRTEAYGSAIYQCAHCGEVHSIPRSCGNRHCPGCQHHKSQQWLATQMERQLPGHHFLLTFTVPESLRPFIRRHQRLAYSALFAASSEAIKALAADPRFIGGDLPGFFGVLHTWGRQLQYHPHIHYVVPGGALSSRDGQWYPSGLGFFLPVRALSRIFRAKFRDRVRQMGASDEIPPEAWECDWNVHCQAVGAAEGPLTYLAPYVFKVAIANSRIVKVEDEQVFFRYSKPHSNRLRTMALPVMEFIRRFLQHVLPTGFMKVRYYGFLSPTSSVPLEDVTTRIQLAYGFAVTAPDAERDAPSPMACPHCGGHLICRMLILPQHDRLLRGSPAWPSARPLQEVPSG